jgi:two-component system response regulator MprA
VLVVDDHPDTLHLLGAYLSLSGFDVTLATNGYEALGFSSDRYDAITTDIAMPGMDGVEFIRRVRTNVQHRGPIVAVTGQATAALSAALEGLEGCGCCRLLTKPCDLTELTNTLRTLLGMCMQDGTRCPAAPRPVEPRS